MKNPLKKKQQNSFLMFLIHVPSSATVKARFHILFYRCMIRNVDKYYKLRHNRDLPQSTVGAREHG